MKGRLFAISVVALLPAVPASAAGGLSVSNAWMRAMPAGIPSGGYFTLHNGTAKDMVLTGAGTPDCGSLMLHKSEMTGGMSSMHHVDEVDVPAGGSVAFAPGGYHLMCMNAGPAIKPGGKTSVTLMFKDGSKFTASFDIRNAAGK
ncbi:MAG TPA: copper chaperone PCu(A)C [Rhizomicrobium sp.]|nr:copper chaperone PCu(A)C [Rhizomicrobium sp.]